MKRILFLLLLVCFPLLFPKPTFAQNNLPTITIINPIRGNQLGHDNENLLPGLAAQWQATNTMHVPATWLWQYSALENKPLVDFAKSEMENQEFGLFLEIDRNFAAKSGVQYKGQGPWYFSDGLLLTSYDANERHKLIDTAFAKFRQTFGYYPKTVGSWWIGADSLTYMQQKYGITSAMKAADQYNLDVYTIWGSPWAIPYVASKENESIPADTLAGSSKVVVMQWAARDPLRGYGGQGDNGMFSTQDFESKAYDLSYFDYLLSLYLQHPSDQIVVGLENSNATFFTNNQHYVKILQEVVKLQNEKKVQIQTAKDFANNFLAQKQTIAPTHIFLSKDFSTTDQSFWYITPMYRIAIQKKGNQITLVDVRNYVQKYPEDFALLPNSQGQLRVNTPFLIDTATFPEQKIILDSLSTPSSMMEIKQKNNQIQLLAEGKILAVFNPNQAIFPTIQKTFSFYHTPFSFSPFWSLVFLFVLYFGTIFLFGKKKKQTLLQAVIFLIPLFWASTFLQTSPVFFDRKQTLLFHFFFLPHIALHFKLFFFRMIPFLLLFTTHALFAFWKNKPTVYYLAAACLTIIFFHVPYFPLDRSTYAMVGLLLGGLLIIGCIATFFVWAITKSRKTGVFTAVTLGIFFLTVLLGVIVSRSKEILTPFEFSALTFIASKHTAVVYLAPPTTPTYKAVRPLLLDDLSTAAKLTALSWGKIHRESNNTLILPDGVHLIFVPKYLGSLIYPEEIVKYHLQIVFENTQISIFEEK